MLDSSRTVNGSGMAQAMNTAASNQEYVIRWADDETGFVITETKSGRTVEDRGLLNEQWHTTRPLGR